MDSRFPLHNFIINHQPERLIDHIKNNPDYIRNAINEQGLTLLQLAAREGMVEAVLWLLYAGEEIDERQLDFKSENPRVTAQAKKTALHFSWEYQHPIITHILLVCGADKNKVIFEAKDCKQSEIDQMLDIVSINPLIVDAILFWQIKNAHKNYVKQWLADQIAANKDLQLVLSQKEKIVIKNPTEESYKIDIKDANEKQTNEHISSSSSIHENMCLVSESNDSNKKYNHEKKSDAKSDSSTNQSAPHWLLEPMCFAAYLNAPDFFNSNFNFSQVQHIPEILSPSYWAARKKNKNLYNQLCLAPNTNEADPVKEGIALYQLKRERNDEIFDLFCEKISKKGHENALQLENKECENHCSQNLSKQQLNAYKVAARAHVQGFRLGCKNEDDFYAILEHALTQRDFIALHTLMNVKTPQDILKYLLQTNKHESAAFLIIVADLDLYKLALEWKNEKSLLKLLQYSCSTPQGMLHKVMSRGILKNIAHENQLLYSCFDIPKTMLQEDSKPSNAASLNTANILDFSFLEKEMVFTRNDMPSTSAASTAESRPKTALDILLRCIQDRYPEFILNIDIRLEIDTRSDKVTQQAIYSIKNEMSAAHKGMISAFIQRFDLPNIEFTTILKDDFFIQLWAPGIWGIVFEYLEEKDHNIIETWNQFFHDRIQFLRRGPEWDKEAKIFTLQQKIAALNNFISLSKDLLTNKTNWCSNRFNLCDYFWLTFDAAWFAEMGFALYETIIYGLKATAIANQADNFWIDIHHTTTCWSYTVNCQFYRSIDSQHCKDICDAYHDKLSPALLAAFGGILGGGIILFMFWMIRSCCAQPNGCTFPTYKKFVDGNDRFLIQYFINDLTDLLNTIRELFPQQDIAEFADAKPITAAMTKAQALLTRAQTELDTLCPDKKADKKANENKENPDDLALNQSAKIRSTTTASSRYPQSLFDRAASTPLLVDVNVPGLDDNDDHDGNKADFKHH